MSKLLHTNYQLRWKNYRRFEDTGWLTIRPITVLIGPNNCGKSSILSPLLLLAQTMTSSDAEAPLITRGRLADVGMYRDFIHRHEDVRDLYLGLKFHTHLAKKRLKKVGAYPPGAVELIFTKCANDQGFRLKEYALQDIYGRPYISRTSTGDGLFNLEGVVALQKMTAREKRALEKARPTNFLFSPTTAIHALRNTDLEEEGGTEKFSDPDKFSDAFTHYLKVTGYTYSEMGDVFRALSYVGPSRRKFDRFYRIAAETPKTVGPQGQNAANLLRKKLGSLQSEIDQWIREFEFGESVFCEDIAEGLFQLCIRRGNEKTNMADAGFGVSQVLPLIVQALAAPEESLTLAEQPEIHLNPRLQSVLANLFVHMAKTKHRVLVETHSEHLVTRLRTLVARGEIDHDDIGLYYVERDVDRSMIREVPIGESGRFAKDAWPKGFFDDALRESLSLATAQSKSARAH